MKYMNIQDIAQPIKPLNAKAMAEAQHHLDSLAKPPGSLGRLEAYAIQLCGITGMQKLDISRRAILVFAADNGVCDENIGSAPQHVTRSQAINIARGMTGVATLASAFGATMVVADVGMNTPAEHPGVRDLCIRRGTGNIRVEDAMSREEALAALSAGATLAQEMARHGYQLLGVGEMGIGNTTTSTAVLSALTGLDTEDICGRGGGIGDERLARKRVVLHDILQRATLDPDDPVGILAQVGGLDICAMAGSYIGAASVGLPVVIDGLIGAVAALAAVRIAPQVQPYLFASHASDEPGAKYALEQLGLKAPLEMNMRLGEGSGCPLMFSMLDAACAIQNNMATFEEAQINPDYLEDVQK